MDNITVNGKPVKEYIDGQFGEEIQRTRSTDASAPVYRPPHSRPKANTSGARTGAGVLVYQAGQKAQKVIIDGTVFAFADKAPFTASGHSAMGALVTTADESEIQCHECGSWVSKIFGTHLRCCSGLSSRAYKLKHGFKATTGLVSPVTRKKMAANARSGVTGRRLAGGVIPGSGFKKVHLATDYRNLSYEKTNLRMNCRAQLVQRLTTMAATIGHCPSRSELRASRIQPETIEWAFGMKLREALRAMGLTQQKPGGSSRQRIAAPTELEILQLLSYGHTYRQIATKLGCGLSTISRLKHASASA